MTILIDTRTDGSLALYIEGDLQFDSRDERIYHEALALPALALARRRLGRPLRALICGGGDGMTARELLKDPLLERVDMVDYDPTILSMARGIIAPINEHSLADLRVWVHVEDAWLYVERAASEGTQFDVIIADFTTPQEADGARLHTVEWYRMLRSVLHPQGVLAANTASPAATPSAYWCVYNTLRTAELHPRPYRIVLPSFADHNYGDDWGFILCSPTPIEPAELDDQLPLAGPRQQLRDQESLRRLFRFPSYCAEVREHVRPVALGSQLLLQSLRSAEPYENATDTSWDGLGFDIDPAPLLELDRGEHLLPPAVRDALLQETALDEDILLQRLLKLMPALQRFQTKQLVADFVRMPGRLLEGIDLRGLVDRLLRRAAELPAKVVAELKLLRTKIEKTLGNNQSLLNLGMRVVTVLLLVVIVANLLYPETVYGKGGGTSGSVPSSHGSVARPSHGTYDVVAAPPDYVTGGGFRSPSYGRSSSVDEVGSLYPSRTYYGYGRPYYSSRTYYYSNRSSRGSAQQSNAYYRLTPEADILEDGRVVIYLNADAYLLLTADNTVIIETKTGEPLAFLARDEALYWRIAKEIDRQHTGMRQSVQGKQDWINWMSWLGFSPWHDDDLKELENLKGMQQRLELAKQSLGTIPVSQPSLPTPPIEGAIEIFTSVWMDPAAKFVLLKTQENGLVYLDRAGWYTDSGRTQPLPEAYPAPLRSVLVAYLDMLVKDSGAARTGLDNELRALREDLTALQRDEREYNALRSSTPMSAMVEYGATEISLQEALRRTDEDLKRTQQRITQVEQRISNLPSEVTRAGALSAALK